MIQRDVETRLVALETQFKAFVDRFESEKGTHARSTAMFMEELKDLKKGQANTDKYLYMALGALGVLQVVLKMWN